MIMEVIEKPKEPSIWEYLIPDDLAESLMARAESLSKKGRLHDAMRAFEKAAELFGEIEAFLDVRDWEVEDIAERERIAGMREAALLKRKYCLTRVNQEAEMSRVEDSEVPHLNDRHTSSDAIDLSFKPI